MPTLIRTFAVLSLRNHGSTDQAGNSRQTLFENGSYLGGELILRTTESRGYHSEKFNDYL